MTNQTSRTNTNSASQLEGANLLHYLPTSLPTCEYRFNVYHRNVTIDDFSRVSRKSAGHFFVSLEGDGREAFVGKYGSNSLYGIEDIRSKEEAKIFEYLRKLEEEHNKKYIDKKSIKISKENFDRAIQFIENKKPEYYTFLFNNCIEFVQKVYNSTGLPLYFSCCMYRKDQLKNLKGPAAEFLRLQYPSIDKIVSSLKIKHASSIDEIKAELNVDEKYIFNLPGEYIAFYMNIDIYLLEILNLQVENSEINGKVIKKQRVKNLLNLVKKNRILMTRPFYHCYAELIDNKNIYDIIIRIDTFIPRDELLQISRAINSIRILEVELWEKEPNSDIFVDLLQPFLDLERIGFKVSDKLIKISSKHRFLYKEFIAVKIDQVSTDLRVAGNGKYKENNWRGAMEYYNQSLRFTKSTLHTFSENASLAYANRSACFFRMQKYTECLKDIEMARDTGYAKRLMRKLDEREAHCLEKIKEEREVEDDIEPKLSFDPDEKFPCMANVLEIKCNERYGQHIVAKSDIDVGQTVVVEEPFFSTFMPIDQTICSTCMLPMKNFIPCDDCTDAMFCDEKCMLNNDVHKISCGSDCNRWYRIMMVLKSILIALNAFDTVDELMMFVEKEMALEESQFNLDVCSETQAKYAMFLKLSKNQKKMDTYTIKELQLIYGYLMAMPTVEAHVNSLKKQRFLLHLIWQHKLLVTNNQLDHVWGSGRGAKLRGHYGSIGIIASLIKHTCCPNVGFHFNKNRLVFTTVKPLMKGQQLFFIDNADILMSSTEERRKWLHDKYNFICQCYRCVPILFENIDLMSVRQDPMFAEMINYTKIWRTGIVSNKERLIWLEKGFQFMRKYGHLPSTCLHVVYRILVDCLGRGDSDSIQIFPKIEDLF